MPIDLTKVPKEEPKESPLHKLYRMYTDPVAKTMGVEGAVEDLGHAGKDDSKLKAQLKGFASGAGGAVSPEHLGTVLSMIPSGGASVLPRVRNLLGLMGNAAMTTHGATKTAYDATDPTKSKWDVGLDVVNTAMGALGAGTNIHGFKVASQAATAANAANAAKPSGLRVALDTARMAPTGPATPDVVKAHETLAGELKKNPGGNIGKTIYGEKGAPTKEPSIVDMESAHEDAQGLLQKEKDAQVKGQEKEGVQMTKNEKAREGFIQKHAVQDARNENAREKFIDKSAGQEARNENAREKFVAKDQAQTAKNENARDKFIEKDNAQEARNQNTRDKFVEKGAAQEAKNENAKDKYLDTLRKGRAKDALAEDKKVVTQNKQATAEQMRDEANLSDVMKWREAEDAKKAQQALVDKALGEGTLQPETPSVTTSAKGVGPEGESQTLRQRYAEPRPETDGGEGGGLGDEPAGPFSAEEVYGRDKAIRRANALGGPTVARILKQNNGVFRIQHVSEPTPGAVTVSPEMEKALNLTEMSGEPRADLIRTGPDALPSDPARAAGNAVVKAELEQNVEKGTLDPLLKRNGGRGSDTSAGAKPEVQKQAGPPEVAAAAPEAPPEPPVAPAPKPKGKGPKGGPKAPTAAAKAPTGVTPERQAELDAAMRAAGHSEETIARVPHVREQIPATGGATEVVGPTPAKADLTTAEPTPTVVKPAKGKTPKPAKGVAAVKNQLERVIDVSGEKTAKLAKDKILAALQEELPAAEENSNVLNSEHSLAKPKNRGRELSDAAIASQASNGGKGAGQLVVRIPGDGTFTVQRNPVAIREFMRRIDRESSSIWSDLKGRAPEGGAPEAPPIAQAPETPPVAAPEAVGAPEVPQSGPAPIRFFKSPLEAAGENLGDIKGAKKAGEVVPEAGRSVAGAAAQRINKEAAGQIASGAKSPEEFTHLPQVGQDALFREVAKRMKSEKGAADLESMLRLTGGLAGGLAGYTTDPLDNPTMSAVTGAGLGAIAPSVAKALPQIAPRVAPVMEKGLDWANKIHNTALLSPLSVVKKALGDVGGLTTAGLMNPSRAGSILKQFVTPEGLGNLKSNFKEGFNGPEQEALSGLENFIQKGPMSWAGRTMGGLTKATKGALGEAGFTPEEQAYYTLTAKPQTAFGKGAKVFLDTKLMQHISPFARIGINRLERGIEFSPLGLIKNPKEYATAEGVNNIFSKAALGSAAGTGAYLATPDNFVRDHPVQASLISAAGGPLGIPILAGMAAKQTHKGDQAQGVRANLQAFDDAGKAIAQDVPGLRLFEDLSAKSKEAFLRNYLSGYTNFSRPLAIAMDPYTKWDSGIPQPEDPDTSSKNLDLPGSLFNRMLSNVPIERSTLPRRDGSTPLTLEEALSQTIGQ